MRPAFVLLFALPALPAFSCAAPVPERLWATPGELVAQHGSAGSRGDPLDPLELFRGLAEAAADSAADSTDSDGELSLLAHLGEHRGGRPASAATAQLARQYALSLWPPRARARALACLASMRGPPRVVSGHKWEHRWAALGAARAVRAGLPHDERTRELVAYYCERLGAQGAQVLMHDGRPGHTRLDRLSTLAALASPADLVAALGREARLLAHRTVHGWAPRAAAVLATIFAPLRTAWTTAAHYLAVATPDAPAAPAALTASYF